MKWMTLAEAAASSNVMLALSQFIDDFNRADNKLLLISEKPEAEGVGIIDLCLMASMAHKLAVDNKLTVPEWVYAQEFILPYPVYAHNTEDKKYQNYLKETTPPEFTQRNLFFGDRVLSRM